MGDALGHEIFCKKCGHYEQLTRAARSDDTCPACGAGVFRRNGPPPNPLSHLPLVLRALFSLRGVLFIIGVALLASMPHWTLWLAAAVMITLASLKFAGRAMHVTRKDGLEFPEVSPEELFERSALWPAGVFALAFLMLPRVLFAEAFVEVEDPAEAATAHARAEADDDDGAAAAAAGGDNNEDDEEEEDGALDPALQAAMKKAEEQQAVLRHIDNATGSTIADVQETKTRTRPWFLVAALLLFLYAPMALVSYLRTGTTWAFFLVPQGFAAIAADLRGYARLCAVAVTAFLAAYLLDAVTYAWPFYLEPLVLIPRNALTLVAWAACGLYVRSRARAFSLPLDEDDWVLLTRQPAPESAPGVPARVRPTAVSLTGDDDDFPVVAGTELPPGS